MPGLPSLPSTDDVTRIRPDCRGIMCCSARRIPQNTWLRFQSTSNFHSSSDIWATGAVVLHATRVEHHDVELAVVVDGEVDQALDRLLLRGVAGEEGGAVAGAHLLEARLALRLVAAVDDDRCAFADEGVGDAATDAARAAGDRGDLAVELAHVHPLRQYGDVPPSIEIIEPVMPPPASDASSTATAATSSTSHSRLVADSSANQSSSSW